MMYDPLWYMGFFVLYTFFILVLGRHGFDKSDSIKDYLIANRSLGPVSSVATFGATWFSAASMLGFTGLVYGFGYSTVLFTAVCWFLGATFLVLMVDRLYQFDVVTVPEFFRVRYNSLLLQVVSGITLVVTYILYIAIQVEGFGIVVSKLLDVPYSVGIFLVFLFILYTTFGGLYSVTRTDILNFALILGGSVIAACLVLNEVGGITDLHALLLEHPRGQDFFNPFPHGWSTFWAFLSSFFALGLGLAANPQYLVRVWSARSRETAYSMIGISIVLLSVVYLSLAVVGAGAAVLVPEEALQSYDGVFPYIISTHILSPSKGLILISIVAASISTANSQLLLLSGSVSYDILAALSRHPVQEQKLLNYNRLLIFLLVIFSLLLSLNRLPALVEFSGQIWGMVAATFFFPVFGGLFYSKASKQGAVAAFCGGLVVYVLNYFLIPTRVMRFFHPALPAVLVSGILFFTVKGRFRHEAKANH